MTVTIYDCDWCFMSVRITLYLEPRHIFSECKYRNILRAVYNFNTYPYLRITNTSTPHKMTLKSPI